jgi:Nif-specific regulatory protein
MSFEAATITTAEREANRKLLTISELASVFADATTFYAALRRCLELLGEFHGLVRGFILTDETDGEPLRMAASYCLTQTAKRAAYQRNEGVIGQVFNSGKPVIVPLASLEPLLSDAPHTAEDSQEMSFICVPVLLGRKVLGVFGGDFFYQEGRDYTQIAQFFSIVAAHIALALKVEKAIEAERQSLADENAHLKHELRQRYDFSHIVGTSNAIRQVYEQVAQVAHTNTTVLLLGESGTGKELIAHALHYNSPRSAKPFITVNCAALPETLLESELFGYEKGAFTGAQARKKGRFELADGGTLFLDEIGDIPPATQIKLLRVLQERKFERLGGTETIKVNVRLVAATNKNLEQAIAEGQFREDLFYRLNVFTIFLPPLRERKPDILLLAEHFLEKYEREHGKRIRRISTPAIDMMTSYHWPGNVRELENVIERAVLVCDTNVIHGHHLPPSLQTAEISGTIAQVSLKNAVEAYERDLLQDALKTSRGNKAKAAKLLGTTERILGYKIQNYDIDWQRFKN